jgi:hypothetical protein
MDSKIATTVRQVNISSSHIVRFCVTRIAKIYLFNKNLIYNTILFAKVLLVYIRFLDLFNPTHLLFCIL